MNAPEYRLSHDIGRDDGDSTDYTGHVIAYLTPRGTLVILATVTHPPGASCDLCRAAEAGIGAQS